MAPSGKALLPRASRFSLVLNYDEEEFVSLGRVVVSFCVSLNFDSDWSNELNYNFLEFSFIRMEC